MPATTGAKVNPFGSPIAAMPLHGTGAAIWNGA
jgi:hypothetical protein